MGELTLCMRMISDQNLYGVVGKLAVLQVMTALFEDAAEVIDRLNVRQIA